MNIEIQTIHQTERRCENCNYDCVGLCMLGGEIYTQEDRCDGQSACRNWEAQPK